MRNQFAREIAIVRISTCDSFEPIGAGGFPIAMSSASRIPATAILPWCSIKGILDSVETDSIGHPTPIRATLPRRPLPYRQAVERALLCSRTPSI